MTSDFTCCVHGSACTESGRMEAVKQDARKQLENARALGRLFHGQAHTDESGALGAEERWRQQNPGLSAVIGNG